MPRPENPEVPTNSQECLAIIAEEACKAKPNLARCRYIAVVKEGLEAVEQRARQSVAEAERKAQQLLHDAKEVEETAKEDALREKEAEASLRASKQWRTETAAAIRAEVESELRASQTLQMFEDKQRQSRTATEISTLQEQVRTAGEANTGLQNEITRLRSALTTTKEYLSAVRADRDDLAAQLAPVDPAVLQAEIASLEAERPALTDLGDQLRNGKRQVILMKQRERIRAGEKILQFQIDLESL